MEEPSPLPAARPEEDTSLRQGSGQASQRPSRSLPRAKSREALIAASRRAQPQEKSQAAVQPWQSLRQAPLLIAAALGLVVGDATAAHGPALSLTLLAAGGCAASLLLLVAADSAWLRVAVAVFACGLGHVAAARVYRPNFPADHIARAPMRLRLQLEGVLSADPEANGLRTRLWLAAERINDGQGWRTVEGRVLLTLQHMRRAWFAGDRLRMSVSLRRPRNFGNPGEFDYEGYLARQGIYVTAFAEDDSRFETVGHVEAWVAARLARWRRGVGALFRRTLPEPDAAVLSALIIGTEMALSRDLKTAFSRAGVSHVLSISGLHVGLVAAAGYTLFRWLLARSQWLLLKTNVPKLAAGLSVLPVLLYAGIAGTNVATIRSVVMVLVFVAAVVADRQRHLVVSLAVAAIVILFASPGAALDISFQLSFVAVLGLVLGMERFWPWWKQQEEARLVRLRGWTARLWRPVAVYAVVSISALAATMPLSALHFNQVSLMALLANALVVPLLGSIAVVLGLLAAMLYTISEPLAYACIVVASPCVRLGVWLVEALAAVPYAAIRVVTPTLTELGLLYAGLFAAVQMSGRVRTASVAVLALLAFGDGAWWYTDRYHRSAMRLTFLSVGQGDSAVVEFPGAEVMVIDGGGLGGGSFDVGERVIAPFLWGRKIAHVDYLVLSHPQWDHYGGLAFVAAHFSAREFWSNGTVASSERFASLQRVLQENGVRSIALHRGARRRIGAVEAAVQSPPQALDGWSVNDQSLVLSLALQHTRVLFPGDLETPGEIDLVTMADGELASTILKVPHHGSHTSSSFGFLRAVAPQLAVVSAGFENRFGFPHPDVMRRYAAQHCVLARTDRDGAVQIRVTAAGTVEMQGYRDGSPRWSGAPFTVDSPATGR